MTMTQSAFLDPRSPPTDYEIHAALGESASARWARLAGALDRDYGARFSLRWDGPRSGWCVACKRAGRPFVTLTPRRGGFDALVVLGRAEANVARGLPLGAQARDAFSASPQLHDGRWLFLTIGSDADLEDLLELLAAKLPARMRARLALVPHPA
jgi:hypothetical protein